MKLPTQPYKGCRDFYPEEKSLQSWIFNKFREVSKKYCFQEYDAPMIESFELYAAKSGMELVEKQLYHFKDRGERHVAIRPEMTPTLARMVAARAGELKLPIKWFSIPNLWRYERPQKGRLREHWQFNADILGADAVSSNVEILLLACHLFDSFGGLDFIKIKINHRGLIEHMLYEVFKLPKENHTAFMKLVDAKDKMSSESFDSELKKLNLSSEQDKAVQDYFKSSIEDIIQKFPDQPFSVELKAVFDTFKELGMSKQIEYSPQIIRGLDYYTGLVFEGFDTSSENRRALFGGGRYDNLVSLFSNQKISGIGLGLGDVGIKNFLETHSLTPQLETCCDVFVTLCDEVSLIETIKISERLRNIDLDVFSSMKKTSLKKQLQDAVKSNAKFALLLSESEWKNEKLIVKNLDTKKQFEIHVNDIEKFFNDNFKK